MARDYLVSFRLSDEENAHLNQLAEVHQVDRSTLLRSLVVSAPLWTVRWADVASDPACSRCGGAPPAGFACVTCGASASVATR